MGGEATRICTWIKIVSKQADVSWWSADHNTIAKSQFCSDNEQNTALHRNHWRVKSKIKFVSDANTVGEGRTVLELIFLQYFLMFLEGSILILLLFYGVQFLINKFQLTKSNILQDIFALVTDLHTVWLIKSLSIKKMVLCDIRRGICSSTLCTSNVTHQGYLVFWS